MDMLSTMLHRRSVRQYTDAAIPQEKLDAILYAGLAAASSKNRRPWEFILVENCNTLAQLCDCRPGAANLLGKCKAAIVVAADSDMVDVWVEDCASAITQMHLMADALGYGCCWVQCRLREAIDGRSTEEYVRDILHFPESHHLEAILALGVIDTHPAPRTLDKLRMDKVHYETF